MVFFEGGRGGFLDDSRLCLGNLLRLWDTFLISRARDH